MAPDGSVKVTCTAVPLLVAKLWPLLTMPSVWSCQIRSVGVQAVCADADDQTSPAAAAAMYRNVCDMYAP